MKFFDEYSDFYRKYSINAFPNRLNERYNALIESNLKIIRNRKILDIASHDGRWSFAAVKNGADYVIGIELLTGGVNFATKIMEKYQIPKEKYDFIIGDVHKELKKIKPNYIDTVFLFGFFYHTIYHMELLSEIKRINPKHIIVDTTISQNDFPIIVIKKEKIIELQANIFPHKDDEMIVGWPSKSATEIMLEQIGYDFKYYDWHSKGINDWTHLLDYKDKKRITLIAERNK